MTPHPTPLRIVTLGGLATAAGLLASCGGGPATPLGTGHVLSYDTVSRTVDVTALAAYGGFNGEMNFDGYANGQLTVHVPFGWLVSVKCVNESHLLRHSCAVVSDSPATLGDRPLAFPEASSPDPAAGSPPGTTSTFEFAADRAGTYRIACLVHGHEIDGMWDYLVVGGTAPPSAAARH